MYVLRQQRSSITIFHILTSLRLYLLARRHKPYILFVDEVDHSIDDVEIDYRHESARLNSFRNWPVSTELCQWLEGDDPMMDHKRLSPTCEFVEEVPCGNIPIRTPREYSLASSTTSQSQDVCGVLDESYGKFTRNLEKAKRPNYCSYLDRLVTFCNWDTRRTQTKELLAQAGFFCPGNTDHTMCFYCGMSISNWKPNEDPWEMHCFWMPNCAYLTAIKGHDYQEKIREAFELRSHVSRSSQAGPSRRPLADIKPSKKSPVEIENTSINFSTLSMKDEKPEEGAAAKCTEPLRPDEEHMLCRICYQRTRDVLIIPCNHIMFCSTCSKKLKTCPFCRAFITYTYDIRYS